MSRFANAVANVLLLDERGRRALVESSADWRLEASQARGALDRFWRNCAGAFGVLRVLAAVAIRGIVSRSTLSVLVWSVIGTLGLGALLLFEAPGFRTNPTALPASVRTLLFIALLPQSAVLFFPLVVSAVGTRRRSSATSGLMLVSFVMMFVAVGWVSPKMNQYYRERAHLALSANTGLSAASRTAISREPAEMTLPEMLGAITTSPYPRANRLAGQLSTNLALSCLAPLLLIVGATSKRRAWWVRALRASLVFVAYVAVLVLVSPPYPVLLWGWLVLAMGFAFTCWRAGHSNPSESVPA